MRGKFGFVDLGRAMHLPENCIERLRSRSIITKRLDLYSLTRHFPLVIMLNEVSEEKKKKNCSESLFCWYSVLIGVFRYLELRRSSVGRHEYWGRTKFYGVWQDKRIAEMLTVIQVNRSEMKYNRSQGLWNSVRQFLCIKPLRSRRIYLVSSCTFFWYLQDTYIYYSSRERPSQSLTLV